MVNPDGRGSAPPAFHVMLKPRGAICNLDCAYCYYLSKRELYPGIDPRMSVEMLDIFTRQYIEAQQVPEVTFGWQGGEPLLMGLEFFRRAIELQERYRRPEVRVLNALQTNGTLLDDEWCRFFREHNFLIGLSLDGPASMHDAYRRDKGGAPTFERVMAGATLLRKHGVEFNILTTVHAANRDHPLRVYRFLRDEVGTEFIQFIPIVERDNETGFQEGDRVTDRSVAGRQYGRFLAGVFDEWVRHDVGQVFVQIFDVALAAWMGQRPGLCVFEETCGTALVLEHNGDLYACDHFVEPRHRLGSIRDASLIEMVASEKQRQFGEAKSRLLPQACRACEVRFVCHGGCPKNRISRTPNGEPGLNTLCEGYRAFFNHIDRPMRMMAQELRAGRPAANVMLHMAKEDAELEQRFAQARRNDPCPCGSGRKFKHCHGLRQPGVKWLMPAEMATLPRDPQQPAVASSLTLTGVFVVAAYVAAQMLADIMSLKIARVAGFSIDAGTIIYPFTFTLRDIVHKLLGRAAARAVIVAAGVINIAMAGLFALTARLPPDPAWPLQQEFAAILAPVWRIVLASIIAEVGSELLDTEVYHLWVTRVTRRYQWARVLLSNSASVPLDSLIFTWGAFGGQLPSATVWSIFWANVIVKGLVTLTSLPGIYLVPEGTAGIRADWRRVSGTGKDGQDG